MGSDLSVLLLGPDFEQEQLFPALLDEGGTVCDVVRLALTCKEARAFVCSCVAALTWPRLEQLLLSLPSGGGHFTDHTDSCLLLKRGQLVWEKPFSTSAMTRLIRLETEPVFDARYSRATWESYHNYGTILYSLVDAGAPFFPMFTGGLLQWYPVLDAALRTCVHRHTAPVEESLKAAEDEMERARKRRRL
jgi:hypothetical protein